MTTLISAANNDGEYGRCDAKCYNARLPGCDCICGGANHGKGLEQAVAWTREHGQKLVQETGAIVSVPMIGG